MIRINRYKEIGGQTVLKTTGLLYDSVLIDVASSGSLDDREIIVSSTKK